MMGELEIRCTLHDVQAILEAVAFTFEVFETWGDHRKALGGAVVRQRELESL